MMTLSKIASLAHVSVSTASKAFSMSREVNEQTREMIFEIAKQHGCFKKYYNAKYPKYVIAVICPEFKSRHYSATLSLLQKYLAEHNCEICVASTEFSQETAQELFEYYNKYTAVDGIILIGGNLNIDGDVEIPLASTCLNLKNDDIMQVKTDMRASLEQAIEYFIGRNVKEIGFIGEKNTVEKLKMFSNIIGDKFGCVNEALISITDERFETGGYAAMEKFFLSGKVPRAVICAYDYMAIGAIRCIYDRGLKVPDDVAVMGMDDIPESKFLNPPLSSINPHTDKVCKILAEAMVNRLNDNSFKINTVVTSELCLRKSTQI